MKFNKTPNKIQSLAQGKRKKNKKKKSLLTFIFKTWLTFWSWTICKKSFYGTDLTDFNGCFWKRYNREFESEKGVVFCLQNVVPLSQCTKNKSGNGTKF